MWVENVQFLTYLSAIAALSEITNLQEKATKEILEI